MAREYSWRSDRRVQRINAVLRHPTHDWMIGNIDRAVVADGSRVRLDAGGKLLGELGLRDFGENRVQEALSKRGTLPPACRWHLLGTLQENKINKVLPWVHMVQSVDGLEIGKALAQRAERQQRRLPVLLEVKTPSEPTKHGFVPEAVPEAYAALASLPELDVQGLMTMAPFTSDTRAVRRSFQVARRLFEALQGMAPRWLSMGMSDDLEIAVEEGSTMLRIGRALVGP